MNKSNQYSFSRRAFLGGSLALAAGITVGGKEIIGSECTEDIELVEQTLLLRRLPKSFEGYRIGFLTDIHLGVFIREEFVAYAADLVKKAGIDLLILGGDYIFAPESFTSSLFHVVRSPEFIGMLPRELNMMVFERLARIFMSLGVSDGVVGIYGNHDQWTYPEIGAQIFRQSGINFLVNETRTIRRGMEELHFVGVDDYLTGRPKMPLLSPDPQACRILLSHNPDYIHGLLQQRESRFDVAIAGHTHGGQIRLPFLGSPVINIQNPALTRGYHDDPNLPSYTSRGVGVVEIPYRIACRPEVTVFTLKS